MVSSPSQTSLRSFTTEVTETTKPFQVSEIGNHKSEWSEWDERHGRQCREGSGRVRREVPRYKSSIRPAVRKHRRPVVPLILVSHVPELLEIIHRASVGCLKRLNAENRVCSKLRSQP